MGTDLVEKREKALYQVVNEIPRIVDSLCNIIKVEDINVIKRMEWGDTVSKIKTDLESEPMLLFIGPFGSGKSTFINAALREKLLPTAAKPCTSVVTEVSFKEGGKHTGRIVRFGGSKEEKSYEELLKIIDGPLGGIERVGALHHIELFFDVTVLPDYTTHPIFQLKMLNVKIVDCPGFGAPYIINDDVIKEYVQRASYTFWMSPVDKIGGVEAERILKQIKKNTVTIIPFLTMADKIDDDTEREKVKDAFQKHLGDIFDNKEPRFVSAVKWNKAIELRKSVNRSGSPGNETAVDGKEKTGREIEKLELESGFSQFYHDMVRNGQRREVTDAKLSSALSDLSKLLNDMDSRAQREADYWLREAENMGFREDGMYKGLEEMRRRVADWVKLESKSVADNLETAMARELTDYMIKANGQVKSEQALRIIKDQWKQELTGCKDEWAKHLYDEYKKYADENSINFDDDKKFPTPDMGNISTALGNMLAVLLKGITGSHGESLLQGGIGGALLMGLPAIKGIMIVGSVLTPIAAVAGGVLLLVGAMGIMPNMWDEIKHHKDKARKETESKIRNYIRGLNLAPTIQDILRETHEKLYEGYMGCYDADLKPIVRNLEESRETKKRIYEMKETINELQGR